MHMLIFTAFLVAVIFPGMMENRSSSNRIKKLVCIMNAVYFSDMKKIISEVCCEHAACSVRLAQCSMLAN